MAKPATRGAVAATLNTADSWTDPLVVQQLERVSVSVAGSAFNGTVTLQRMLDGTNWRDVSAHTSDIETSYDGDETGFLRIGIKAGGHTSGSVAVRLGKG